MQWIFHLQTDASDHQENEGDEHTLRGLAGVYQCRMNIIVVSSNRHHTKTIPPQQEQSSSDIVAGIPHVQGGFVHNLYQTGALKLVRQLYISGDAANCGNRVLF
jgi:hypothetical protein